MANKKDWTKAIGDAKKKHTIQQELGSLSGKGMCLVKGLMKVVQRLVDENEKLWSRIKLLEGEMEQLGELDTEDLIVLKTTENYFKSSKFIMDAL